MMRNNKKIGIAIALLLALCALFALGVGATVGDDWNWTVTPDAETVSNGQNSWTYFWFPKGTMVEPKTYYKLGDTELYAEDVDIEMGRPYGLTPEGGDLIWTGNGEKSYINGVYISSGLKTSMQLWLEGYSENYRLYEQGSYNCAYYDHDLTVNLSKLKATRSINVRELENYPCYEIYIFDMTDTVGYPVGNIYKLGSEYYYLDFEDLPNSQFDSNGMLSYRSGTVSLARMTDEHVMLTEVAIGNMAPLYSRMLTVEDDTVSQAYLAYLEEEKKEAITEFWIVYAIIFLVLPVPIMIVSALITSSRKKGYPTYYASVTVAAGIWMLVGVGLAILLLIV